jgi:hypothetical protein
MENEFNAFGQHGATITEPTLLLWLEGQEDQIYGTNDGGTNVNEGIEWMVMAVLGIPLGKVKEYCKDPINQVRLVMRRHNYGPGYEKRVTYFKYG